MSKPPTSLTPFNYLILGLTSVRPHTGYSLASAIRETSMAAMTDSPGSVYPALRKLESQGLIQSVVIGGGSKRKRRQFHISPDGVATLAHWLAICPDPLTVLRQPALLVVKLAFSPPDQLRSMMNQLADRADAQVEQLRRFATAAGPQMPPGPNAATAFSLQMLESLADWCRSDLNLSAEIRSTE